MGFAMFSGNGSPIAIDFGTANVKLLQMNGSGKPTLGAAAQLEIPDVIRDHPPERMGFFGQSLPKLLKSGGFKGKRVICAVPASQTFIQHMQLMKIDSVSMDDQIKTQLQTQLGCMPNSLVVRSVPVTTVHRDGQNLIETICFAISKETVMHHIDMLRRCRLDVVGVHVDTISLVRVFESLNRRAEDQLATLYVDIGWGGTRATIAHGDDIVFARCIPVGGRQFDELMASKLSCDLASARGQRVSVDECATSSAGAPPARAAVAAGATSAAEEPSTATATAGDRRQEERGQMLGGEVLASTGRVSLHDVDLSEPLDTIADELSMCLRYHRGLFPDRRIDRVIFLGGESRQTWLCRYLVGSLALPSHLGDPLGQVRRPGRITTPGVDFTVPQPGWAVAHGLTMAPGDM